MLCFADVSAAMCSGSLAPSARVRNLFQDIESVERVEGKTIDVDVSLSLKFLVLYTKRTRWREFPAI